jgi:hypothetical protein
MNFLASFLKTLQEWAFNFRPVARLNRAPVWSIAVLVVMVVMVEGGAREMYDLVNTTGVMTAPSVEGAHAIKAGAAHMVAVELNELAAPPGANYDLVTDFESTRVAVQKELVNAAHNITYKEEEEPLNRLQDAFGELLIEATKARGFHEHHDGFVLASARHLLNDILTKELIPAADDLAKVNQAHFDAAYAKRSVVETGDMYATLGAGGLVCLSLLLTMGFSAFTFKRTVNIFWTGAFAVSLLYVFFAHIALVQVDAEIYNADTNAYPSVVALNEARTNGWLARAEQSMWMLDLPQRDEHLARYVAYGNLVAKPTPGHSFEQAIAQAKKGGTEDAITGALATELNNITFDGEREAATQTLQAYVDWLTLGTKIGTLENSGQHAQALALLMGKQPGENSYVFARFNDLDAKYGALGTTIKINHDPQDASIKQAFWWLHVLEIVTPIAALTIFALVILGWLFLHSMVNPARYAHAFSRRRAQLTA